MTMLAAEGRPHGPTPVHAHSTPDPESPERTPPDPRPPVPDDVPDPVNAPVEEPGFTDPPIRAN